MSALIVCDSRRRNSASYWLNTRAARRSLEMTTSNFLFSRRREFESALHCFAQMERRFARRRQSKGGIESGVRRLPAKD
jgi:hypothetical protein